MRLIDKTPRWDFGKILEGRKKNYKVIIHYSEQSINKKRPFWYFELRKDDYAYNSLWDNLKFESQDQCCDAAESKIEELIKVN